MVSGALAESGPVGEVVGNFVLGKVLDAVFGHFEDKDPSAQEIRAAFEKQLEDAGMDVSSGEGSRDALIDTFAKTLGALNDQLAAAKTQDEKNDIQKQINLIEELKDGIASEFGAEIDSGDSGGQIGVQLDQRGDKPNR